jgi:hypothetical protein
MIPGATATRRAWAVLALTLALDVVSLWRATAQPASDVRTYHRWIIGPLPSWSAPSPYPVGADLLWWPLRWAPAPDVNLWWLLGCTGPVTIVACVVLARTARYPLPAVTVWLLAAGLLERSYWMRLEPVAALAVLLAVVGIRRGRAAGPGAALALGALVKVWPGFLLPLGVLGLPGRRPRLRFLAAFAVPWLGYGLALLALRPPEGTTWLTFTFSRRPQAEALSVLPTLWAMAGGDTTWRMVYSGGLDSADVVLGPGLSVVRAALQALALGAIAALTVRVVRWYRSLGDPGLRDDTLPTLLAAQAAFLLLVVFAGPALSPQYLLWFAPLFAVAAGAGCLGREVGLWLVGCALTFVEFPLLWNEMRAADPLAVAALTARDAVLVALLVACLARVRTGTTPVRAVPGVGSTAVPTRP